MRAAASPMISTHFTRPNIQTWSVSKSGRPRPFASLTAAWAASNMWRNRIRSSGGILDLGGLDNLLPEVAAKFGRGGEVNFSPQYFRKFQLQSGNPDKTDAMSGLEFHEHVHVAFRPESDVDML